MAIIKTSMTESGITVENSYARIDTVSGSKDSIQITLNSYVNQQSFIDGKSYLTQEVFNMIPSVTDDAPNFIKQGYEYLKTLPMFSNAIDA